MALTMPLAQAFGLPCSEDEGGLPIGLSQAWRAGADSRQWLVASTRSMH